VTILPSKYKKAYFLFGINLIPRTKEQLKWAEKNVLRNYPLQPCNEGWYFADGMCYMMIADYMDWNNSRDHCTSLGAQLASIHNERVNGAIVDRFDVGWSWLGIPFVSSVKL